MNQECAKCKISKPFTAEFFVPRKENNSLRKQCKECMNARNRLRRVEDPERHRKYEREYIERHKDDPEWAKKRIDSDRKRRLENPEMYREANRRHYNKNKDNPEWMSAIRERIYEGRKENPDRYRAALEKYKKNNPEKIKARNDYYDSLPEEKSRRLLRKAIKAGEIIRPETCSKCAVTCKPDGHHEDYSRPFDVIWLCHKCHMALHRKYSHESKNN